VTKHAFAASASPDALPVRNKQRIRITDVLDGGDGRGIICLAGIRNGKEMLGISIAHLRLDMHHPLYKEVRSYQIDRTKRLARGRRSSRDQQDG
jgi:hypothetical protein